MMTGRIIMHDDARGEPANDDHAPVIEVYSWEPRPGCREVRAWTRVGDVDLGVTIYMQAATQWWPGSVSLEICIADCRDRWWVSYKWRLWLPEPVAEATTLEAKAA